MAVTLFGCEVTVLVDGKSGFITVWNERLGREGESQMYEFPNHKDNPLFKTISENIEIGLRGRLTESFPNLLGRFAQKTIHIEDSDALAAGIIPVAHKFPNEDAPEVEDPNVEKR